MKSVFHIGVGSNIDPEHSIPEALSLLQEQVTVTAVSPFYWSESIGSDGTPNGHSPYLNGVIEITTDLDALQLKRNVLQPIETTLGRIRNENRFADRTLDLDILLWGKNVIRTEQLHIPDADICRRAFVALPLLETAGNIFLPAYNRFLKDVVEELNTASLRKNREISNLLLRRMAGKETK